MAGFTELTRRLMADRGISVRGLAKLVHYDQGGMSKILRGLQPCPPYLARAIDDVLEAGGEIRQAAGASVRPATRGKTRRQTETQPWELADTLTRSSISMTAISFMEESVTSLAARYPSAPPADLVPDVQSMLGAVNDALGRSQPVNVRARCVRLTGVLCGVAGQLADDTGRPDQSAAWFSAAGVAADETGDTDLAAWTLALRSIGCHFRGEYVLAAELLDCARATVTAASTARRRAWLAALSARTQAAVAAQRDAIAGGAGDIMRSLDDARVCLESASEASDTDFFDRPRLAGMAGTALLLLRDTRAAREHLTDALAARDPGDVKGRALLALDLAECYAIGREPEHAAVLASGALDMASGGIVRPVVTRAAAVRRALRQWEAAPAVRELGEQLGEIMQEER